MVNILISNRDVSFANNLENMLANDKNYVFKITTTEADTISNYNIDRLSIIPNDFGKPNIVLTLEHNSSDELNNVEKVSSIIYKPINTDKLIASIRKTANRNQRPELTKAEVSVFLKKLNLNCYSPRFQLHERYYFILL